MKKRTKYSMTMVWVFHGRTMNNNISHLHERCLHKMYSNNVTILKTSEKYRSVPIYIRNLQILATRIFKVSKDLVPVVVSQLFSK